MGRALGGSPQRRAAQGELPGTLHLGRSTGQHENEEDCQQACRESDAAGRRERQARPATAGAAERGDARVQRGRGRDVDAPHDGKSALLLGQLREELGTLSDRARERLALRRVETPVGQTGELLF